MQEPSISFHNAALKIEWAMVLIGQLEDTVARFIQEKPYLISTEKDAERNAYNFKVGLTRPIPPAVPLIIGDICQNLRSALDYAWMGLVRAHAPGQSKKTMPIADNRKGLISSVAQAPIGAARQQAETLLVDTIKSHRDFADGGNAAIIALNEMSNWNKHNLLVLSVGVTHLSNVFIKTTTIGGLTIDSLEVKGNVASVASLGGEILEFSYDREPAVEIVFRGYGSIDGQPIIPTLTILGQVAAKSLQAFCEAFPSPENPKFR